MQPCFVKVREMRPLIAKRLNTPVVMNYFTFNSFLEPKRNEMLYYIIVMKRIVITAKLKYSLKTKTLNRTGNLNSR